MLLLLLLFGEQVTGEHRELQRDLEQMEQAHNLRENALISTLEEMKRNQQEIRPALREVGTELKRLNDNLEKQSEKTDLDQVLKGAFYVLGSIAAGFVGLRQTRAGAVLGDRRRRRDDNLDGGG